MHLFTEAILLYLSSLERKSFLKLKKTQLFYLGIKLRKPFAVPRAYTDEKLREVSVSYFFRTENYTDVIGEPLTFIINKHNYKTFSKKSSCIFGTLHRKRFESFVWKAP